jgi:YHS domain-containing protein
VKGKIMKMEKDPVCGMEVDPNTATQKIVHKGTAYYFCSEGCRKSFEKDPEKYLAKSGSSHSCCC